MRRAMEREVGTVPAARPVLFLNEAVDPASALLRCVPTRARSPGLALVRRSLPSTVSRRATAAARLVGFSASGAQPSQTDCRRRRSGAARPRRHLPARATAREPRRVRSPRQQPRSYSDRHVLHAGLDLSGWSRLAARVELRTQGLSTRSERREDLVEHEPLANCIATVELCHPSPDAVDRIRVNAVRAASYLRTSRAMNEAQVRRRPTHGNHHARPHRSSHARALTLPEPCNRKRGNATNDAGEERSAARESRSRCPTRRSR